MLSLWCGVDRRASDTAIVPVRFQPNQEKRARDEIETRSEEKFLLAPRCEAVLLNEQTGISLLSLWLLPSIDL
jgi:hypothetical protein